MTTIYRVQHRADGRGPYRPGVSKLWASEHGPEWPSILAEFGGDWIHEIPKGHHAGCAFLTLDALLTWFLPSERAPLRRLGYQPVRLDGASVLRQGALQIIFTRPLAHKDGCQVIPWGMAERMNGLAA